jgi:hypothetical protein
LTCTYRLAIPHRAGQLATVAGRIAEYSVVVPTLRARHRAQSPAVGRGGVLGPRSECGAEERQISDPFEHDPNPADSRREGPARSL